MPPIITRDHTIHSPLFCMNFQFQFYFSKGNMNVFQFLNMLIQIKYLPIFHDISLKNVWVSMKFSNFEGRVIILLRKPNKIYLHILLTWKEIFLEISSHFPFMRKNLYFLCEHFNTSWLFELLCSSRILVLSWMCFIWIQLLVGLINCSLASVSPKKCSKEQPKFELWMQ